MLAYRAKWFFAGFKREEEETCHDKEISVVEIDFLQNSESSKLPKGRTAPCSIFFGLQVFSGD
jgi:hypothetical protein